MRRDLGNGLILREAKEADLTAIIEHVIAIHGKDIGLLIERLFNFHPDFPPNDNFIVVDSQTRKVVAYLCLLRSTCILNGISLAVGHMEIVGTLPGYRNRGLIRQINELFEARVREYQLTLLVIAGIPYYYRTFGYEYAIPLGGYLSVPQNEIPTLKKSEQEPVIIEEITDQTLNLYLRARKERNSYLDFYRTLTSNELFFLIQGKLGQELVHKFYVVKDHENIVGSFYLTVGWGALQVGELWVEEITNLPTILRFVKTIAEKKRLPLRVEPPSRPAIHQALEGLIRGKFLQPYAWYVRIPSIPRFLETIKAVLEQRLAQSEFAQLSDSLRLSWYREGVELIFNKGKLKVIQTIKREDIKDTHIGVPFPVIYQLLMGYRSLDNLQQLFPDVQASAMKAPIVRILFPQIRAMLTPEF